MSMITKVVIGAFFVIFILPMAGIVMLQGAASYKMASLFAGIDKKLNDQPALRAFPNVTNAKGKNDLLAMAEFNQLSDYRVARIIYSINVNDLRDSKGEKISGSRVKSLSNIIASVYANKECDLINHKLASTCDVLSSKGKIYTHHQKKKDFLKISIQLRFVQKNQFGAFDPDAEMQFEEIKSPVFGGKSARVPYRNNQKLSAWRLKIYEKITDNCDAIKKTHGNCAINGLRIISSIKKTRNRTFYYAITGNAYYGVLKDEI